MNSYTFIPGEGVARAVLVTVGDLCDDEVATLCRDLCSALSLSLKNGILDRTEAARALMEAPQRYVDAVRVMSAARRHRDNAVREQESFLAPQRHGAFGALVTRGIKTPRAAQIDDFVRWQKQTQVEDHETRVSDAEAALEMARALVRAWDPANRETTIRRLLDDAPR